LSWVYVQKQQYDQALAEDERAIALDPNNADSYAVLAEALGCVGESGEAIAMVEQALRPPSFQLYLFGFLGQAYYLAGRP
jgi:Tfp pilus assembly protein PilF